LATPAIRAYCNRRNSVFLALRRLSRFENHTGWRLYLPRYYSKVSTIEQGNL